MEQNNRCAVKECPFYTDDTCPAAEYCAGFVPMEDDYEQIN